MRTFLLFFCVNFFLFASAQSVLQVDSIKIGNQSQLLNEMNLDGPIRIVTNNNLSGGAVVVKNPESTKNSGINLINDINNRLILFCGGSNRPDPYQANGVGMYSVVVNSSQEISYYVLGNRDHSAPIIFIQNNQKVFEIDEDGNIEIINPNSGLIMSSPNGSRFKLTVDDEGNLTTSTITSTDDDVTVDESMIDIYPNPTTGMLNIEIADQNYQDLYVEVYDIMGNVIYMNNYTSNSFIIDTQDFKDGTYVLKIKDSKMNLIKSQKFIKN